MRTALELSSFEPLGQLGHGGTANVEKVFAKRLGRLAALKYPSDTTGNPEINFSVLSKRERQLVAGLRYPGIVRILDASTEKPEYLLMELCRGPTLEQILPIQELPPALNIISAVAINLEFLRARDIIHGDLKPNNVFLSAEWRTLGGGQPFYVKLSDFSLGRFGREPDTERTGLGTVGYMAPETVVDSKVTFASDIFALGIIAYQLLSGRHPFMDESADPVRINSRIREEDPIPLKELCPHLSDGLVDLVDRLMSKEASQRPQSGWEICLALRRAGATYPFEKAIRPAHLLAPDSAYHENVASTLRLDGHQTEQLRLYTDESNSKLRCLLTANFIKDNLTYEDSRFSFANGVYVPLTVRRTALNVYKCAPFKTRKAIVTTSIAGGRECAGRLGVLEESLPDNIPDILFAMLRYFVKPANVRRLSARPAAEAERRELYDIAAYLYLQAGLLEGAERCAYQAAKVHSKGNENEKALRVLNDVIDFGKMTGQRHVIRHLLMTRADILKEMGEADRALVTYRDIIETYDNLPPDKLLAETYKDLGDLFKIKQRCGEGLEALRNALQIYQSLDDELEISHTLNNIGNIHWVAGEYDSALSNYRSALRIQKRLSATADLASTLSNVASFYAINGRFKRAIRIFNLSLNLKKEIGLLGEIARTLNNLGYTYFISGVHEKAVSSVTESLKINKKIGCKKEILFNLENLSAITATAGRLRSTVRFLKEGMALARSLDDKPHLGAFNAGMGSVLVRMGRFSDAQKCFGEVERLAREIDDRVLEITLAIERANLYYYLGDQRRALPLAVDAFHHAKTARDKTCELDALLMLTKVSDDSRFVELGLELASQFHLRRAETIINFNRFERLVQTDSTEQAGLLFGTIGPALDEMTEDIELARLCNTTAEFMIDAKQIDRARGYLLRAQKACDLSGLLPEAARTLTLQARISFSEKAYEDCYKRYRMALQICKQIAGKIERSEERQTFQNQRSVTFLVEEIRRLGEFVGQKNRAGIDPALT